jgi:hypothetical protein
VQVLMLISYVFLLVWVFRNRTDDRCRTGHRLERRIVSCCSTEEGERGLSLSFEFK